MNEKRDVNYKRMSNFEFGMEQAERGRATAIKALQLSEIKLEESNLKLHIWYRNPILWFVVGTVVGVGFEAALFAGLNY